MINSAAVSAFIFPIRPGDRALIENVDGFGPVVAVARAATGGSEGATICRSFHWVLWKADGGSAFLLVDLNAQTLASACADLHAGKNLV